jgi:hypothetical protein
MSAETWKDVEFDNGEMPLTVDSVSQEADPSDENIRARAIGDPDAFSDDRRDWGNRAHSRQSYAGAYPCGVGQHFNFFG